MKISAGVSFYQDRDSLKRTLDSLFDFDEVICVDGRYQGFQSDSPLSTDGSRELVQSYKNTKLIDASGLREPDKRNEYLKACTGDVLLVIDSDDWIDGAVQTFRQNIPKDPGIYSIEWVNFEGLHSPTAMVIVQPHNFSYYQAHNIMKNLLTGEVFKIRGDYGKLVKGIILHSNDALRSRERMAQADAYKVQLMAYERPIKVSLRIG